MEEEDDQQSTGAVANSAQRMVQVQARRSLSNNVNALVGANAGVVDASCIVAGHEDGDVDGLGHHHGVGVVVSDGGDLREDLREHEHEHDHHLHHAHQHQHHHHHHHQEHHHHLGQGLPPALHLHDTDADLDDVEGIVGGGGDKTDSPLLLKSSGREPATEWSEAATAVLISAFREKFHALDRNNFRSKDWGEVAKQVNTHCANEKTHKTQEQCRMKVDSLKKRYRQEKDKLAGNVPCKWPWFEALDELIGGSPKQSRIGSARKQARFNSSPSPRPAGGLPAPYFGGLSPSVYLKKKLSRVVSLQDTVGALQMAGTLEDNIEALLQNFLEEETVRDFAKKLASSKYTVATLLEMSERELDEIMAEEFPEAARGERRGFKAAIWSKKRKLTQEDCGDDIDMVNASGSIMETSDNFAKKEKKSGSFVR
ncbi:hypothetical protein M758_3G167500 [Ceratodon purpureus]|nr:hypothetical protein M758_3G167500 [Ceratodon purpureus]